MESPRRNGLTPRDPVAEAELAALLAAQRNGTGSSKARRLQEVLLQEDGDGGMEDEFGRLDLNENLGSYPPPAEPQPTYTCGVCGAKFHIRSLLGAHRRTHDDDFKVRFRGRRPRDSNTTLTAGSQCKFCDRRFDLERTLHIHQMCHCKKIPPQQRRKLAYTELAHEKKAPLPSFQRHSHSHSHSHTRTHNHGGHHSHRSSGRGHQAASVPAMKHPLMQQHEQDLQKTVLSNPAVHERWR